MPGPVRDAERTRAALLTAAARCIADQGVGVSLDSIARAAGVSKGGLLHHFATREELLQALIRHLLTQFNGAVDAELALADDDSPGSLVRAYVRVVFADLAHGDRTREQMTLLGMLGSAPAVEEFIRADDAAWTRRLLADGLDPMRADVIVKAADGATASLMWSRNPPEHYDALRELLLAMSHDAGPLLPD